MFERFTRSARQVVVGAQEEARGLGHDWIGTEHLLLAAVRQSEQPGAATLVRLGVTAENCRAAVASVVSTQGDALGPEDAEALKAFGIDLDEIRRRAEGAFGDGALDPPVSDPGSKATAKGSRSDGANGGTVRATWASLRTHPAPPGTSGSPGARRRRSSCRYGRPSRARSGTSASSTSCSRCCAGTTRSLRGCSGNWALRLGRCVIWCSRTCVPRRNA